MFFQGVAKRDVFMSGSFFFFGTGGSDSGSSAVSIYDNKWHKDFYRDETCNSRLLELMGKTKMHSFHALMKQLKETRIFRPTLDF